MIKTRTPKIGNFVKERFHLPEPIVSALQVKPKPFRTPFAEFVYYRTYSRIMADGGQEHWADTVERVINGVMSIRKQHYYSNNIHWDKTRWSHFATKLALDMFDMKWLPPGRGLWAMGTDYVYERGAMPLYNCAFTDLKTDSLASDFEWLMDSLMNGVGVGFGAVRDGLYERMHLPKGEVRVVQIGDDREGWAHSVFLLIASYLKGSEINNPLEFDDSLVRSQGTPIHGFGGVSSGPEPLRDLLLNIRSLCERMVKGEIDEVQFKTDVSNEIGCCVVAGNIRRSAEIGVAPMSDPVFKDLKDYKRFPERAAIGHMSNNSVKLTDPEDFEKIKEIADRVLRGEDLGYLNMVNIPRGRMGHDDGLREDRAIGMNPCGEIPLEDKEVCNLSETLPTRCNGSNEWLVACRFATFYSCTVTLLPTHQRETNAIVLRNRRIGVSIIDISGWKHTHSVAKVIRNMRRGYDLVKRVNHEFNSEAGIPDSIRNTAIKPGGTVPKIADCTPGNQSPTFTHTLMRVRVAQHHTIFKTMHDACVPHEPDVVTKGTEVFEIPLLQGPAKPATEVSLWEQALNLVMVQMEWADNAVSNTLYYKPMWQKIYKQVDINRSWVQREISVEGWEEHEAAIFNAWDDIAEEEHSQSEVIIKDDSKIEFTWNSQHDCVDVAIWKFDPKNEEADVESVLAHIAPLTKSVALLAHSNEGAFPQMPQEGITKEEYEARLAVIKPIDWSLFSGSDGQDEKFCEGDRCELGGGNEALDS